MKLLTLHCIDCPFVGHFHQAMDHYEATSHRFSYHGVIQDMAGSLRRIKRERADRDGYEAALRAGQQWAHDRHGPKDAA